MALNYSCLSPEISLNYPVYFSLAANVRTFALEYSVTNCANFSSSSSCSFSSPIVSSNTDTFSLPPTTPLGTYLGNITCVQNQTSFSISFNFSIVRGQNFQYSPLSSPISVPDCVDYIVTQNSINFIGDGGITSEMIDISATPSSTGDILLLPTLNDNYVMQFQQSDIDNSRVLFRPTLLSAVASSRRVSLPLLAVDASAQTLNRNALFDVQYSFCPYLPSSVSPNLTLYTDSTLNPIPITSSIVSLTEPHGLNSWDVEWLVSPVGIMRGNLEYFCPDGLCGVGWQELILPASIKQSWLIMNALRWNPSGTNGVFMDQITFTATNSYPRYTQSSPLALNIQLSHDPSQNRSLAAVPLPYSTSENDANCPYTILGATGSNSITPSSFGLFDSLSPIRPLCFKITVGPTAVQFEDFTISATYDNTEITVSGRVKLSSELELPPGFIPLGFTRKDGVLTGQLYHALHIKTSPSSLSNFITITLPQANITAAQYITDPVKGKISILKYDPLTGQLSHITPESWDKTSLVMQAVLPTDGFYIFGSMDMTVGSLVPVSSNQWITYLKDYGKLNTQVDSKPFVLSVIANKDTQIAVMKSYDFVWDPDGYQIVDKFYISEVYPQDNSISLNMTLSYGCDSETPLYWANQIFDGNYTVGYFWNISQNSTTYSLPSCTLALNTSTGGMWAVMANASIISASNFAQASHGNQSLHLIIAALFLVFFFFQ